MPLETAPASVSCECRMGRPLAWACLASADAVVAQITRLADFLGGRGARVMRVSGKSGGSVDHAEGMRGVLLGRGRAVHGPGTFQQAGRGPTQLLPESQGLAHGAHSNAKRAKKWVTTVAGVKGIERFVRRDRKGDWITSELYACFPSPAFITPPHP